MRLKINGECLVSMTVDAKGRPEDVVIVRCTDLMFAPTSLAAAEQYRFKPARDQGGAPVAVKITIGMETRVIGYQDPQPRIRYALLAPPGITPAGAETSGVFPLNQAADPPVLKKFVDAGFGGAAFLVGDQSACEVSVTIDGTGVASDPEVFKCDKPMLEKPAVESLLKSKFQPGREGGKAVPVRAVVQLVFEGFLPTPDRNQ
jgi:hypothetical protein